MAERKLAEALERLAVETGSLACLGCGWEHDCGVHDGCAILRRAREELERLEKANEQLGRQLGADRFRNPTGDLSRDSTKMVPLTLEQLREMDGHPVWIAESPDWGHWELSEDAGDYICDRDTDLYGLTYPDQDGRGGLHKLGWVAYAYPPSRIDREAWELCRVCRQYEVLGFRGWRRQENMLKHPDGSGGCMYCPHCGRPRNEKAWAQLEQRLRGEQVNEQERDRSAASDTGPLLLPQEPGLL